MLFLYFMVGVALAIPEVIFVENIPALKKITEKSPIVEIIFSLVFGMLTGAMMGISSGVTFAVGNVFSTMITKAIYNWHLMEKARKFKIAATNTSNAVRTKYAQLKGAFRLIGIVLLAPFKVIEWCFMGLSDVMGWISERSERTS